MKSTIKRDTLADGVQIARITLRKTNGAWVGDVFLEYGITSEGKTWGRYFSITDYGNYSHAWFFIGRQPFEDFILDNATQDQGYFIDKLIAGQADSRTFRPDKTRQRAKERLDEYAEENCLSANAKRCYLEELERCETPEEFNDWYSVHLEDSMGYESFFYGISVGAEAYKDNIFPLLAEVLRGG